MATRVELKKAQIVRRNKKVLSNSKIKRLKSSGAVK
jgi:hypothetical protein